MLAQIHFRVLPAASYNCPVYIEVQDLYIGVKMRPQRVKCDRSKKTKNKPETLKLLGVQLSCVYSHIDSIYKKVHI